MDTASVSRDSSLALLVWALQVTRAKFEALQEAHGYIFLHVLRRYPRLEYGIGIGPRLTYFSFRTLDDVLLCSRNCQKLH